MKKPQFKIYATIESGSNLVGVKKHLKRKFRAKRISTLEGEDIDSVIFTVPMSSMYKAWRYFQKKRGTKKLWLGN